MGDNGGDEHPSLWEQINYRWNSFWGRIATWVMKLYGWARAAVNRALPTLLRIWCIYRENHFHWTARRVKDRMGSQLYRNARYVTFGIGEKTAALQKIINGRAGSMETLRCCENEKLCASWIGDGTPRWFLYRCSYSLWHKNLRSEDVAYRDVSVESIVCVRHRESLSMCKKWTVCL